MQRRRIRIAVALAAAVAPICVACGEQVFSVSNAAQDGATTDASNGDVATLGPDGQTFDGAADGAPPDSAPPDSAPPDSALKEDGGVALAGSPTIQPYYRGLGASIAQAFRFVAIRNGTAMHVAVYAGPSSTSTRIEVGIYDDVGAGEPGTLLGTGFMQSPAVSKWNNVSLTTGVPIVVGSQYWLAVLSTAGQLDVTVANGAQGGRVPNASLTAMPLTWPASTVMNVGPAGIYAY